MEDATKGSIIIGSTGSGKTLLLYDQIRSVLQQVRGGISKALIFDPKSEMLGIVEAAGVPYDLLSLTDARSIAPDLQAQIQGSFTKIDAVVGRLFAPLGHGEVFWVEAAQIPIKAVLKALEVQKKRYTVATLCGILSDPVLMIRVSGGYRGNRDDIEEFMLLRGDRTEHSVRLTLKAMLKKYAPLAALCQQSSKMMSARDFVHNPECSVLLVRTDTTAQIPSNGLLRMFLSSYFEEILALPPYSGRYYWTVLDELSKLPTNIEIAGFASRCRSVGGCVSGASQTIDSIELQQGEREAADLLANLNCKIFTRQASERSAEVASRTFGSYEAYSTSYSYQAEGGAQSEQIVERRAVLPSEFQALQYPSVEVGLPLFLYTPQLGAVRTVIPGDVVAAHQPVYDHSVVERMPWTAEQERVIPMSEEEKQYLTSYEFPELSVGEKKVAELVTEYLKRRGGASGRSPKAEGNVSSGKPGFSGLL